MSKIKKAKTNKSLGPGYYTEVVTEKGHRGSGHGSTREDAYKKAVDQAKKRDEADKS
jgi:hypothetical protein